MQFKKVLNLTARPLTVVHWFLWYSFSTGSESEILSISGTNYEWNVTQPIVSNVQKIKVTALSPRVKITNRNMTIQCIQWTDFKKFF